MRTTKARSTDPSTSHAAAARVEPQLTVMQQRVLSMFRLYGDMTDERLVLVLNDAEKQAGIRPSSPSAVRSRRNELASPNDGRLDQIMMEMAKEHEDAGLFSPTETAIDGAIRFEAEARRRLRAEGFRSPLWNTGRTERNARGYTVIVWGLAT